MANRAEEISEQVERDYRRYPHTLDTEEWE